ncbi:MAG: dihydropteroate synthase [Euryarchaeota archaeon]|nr:dihydropteroate synthase [Euryarchaeota archaeon]
MADWRPNLHCRGREYPHIMGIVNVTPDSFHPRSRVIDPELAVERALEMEKEGATWIDVGAESTRPGAEEMSEKEEIERLIPVIRGIRSALPEALISADTRKSGVALSAIEAGADMINDVSGLGDEKMVEIVAKHNLPICVMHMRGVPENMQRNLDYDDVVEEVKGELARSAELLVHSGLDASMIVIDPGIGFGKSLDQNLLLLKAGRSLVPDERMSLMWGVSRKSMFKDLLGRESTEERLSGTLGVAAMAKEKGVDILRVHDVGEHVDLFRAMLSVG